jgi:predicted phage terminase large subunit-like protein
MTQHIEQQIKAAKRLLFAQEARDDLLKFMKLTMPDVEDVEDANRSAYEETPQARLLCQIMEKVERRELKRVAVSIGPQLGKSQILSRGAPAWMQGRNPRLNIILGTYNQPFANEFGDAVREIMSSPAYAQVFPNIELRKAAADLLITTDNGRLAFVGRGGSGTGKPADIFLVDDPLKDDKEAQSDATRNEVWNWFNKVALTRCHSKSGIVVVHTRWHQDDLIGRLCDPEHPERNKKYAGISDRWTYINLPAVVDDPKLAKALGLTLEMPKDPFVISMFGSKPMSSLWPGRKDLSFLAEAKNQDPAGFGALYMGQPTPEDGDYFKADGLIEYDEHELPKELEIYAASDHATSTRQQADYTVMGCVGVDEAGTLWVLPDLVWDRMQTDRTVEEMVAMMQRRQPNLWWMESELISKSFGPFLRERMIANQVYTAIDEVTVSKDKQTRGRAIQGRISMKTVRFPRFASWWPEARKQLLRFPNGTNDDFVDFLSHIGMGLLKQYRATPVVANDDRKIIRSGSIEWILARTKREAERNARQKKVAGW